MLGAGDLIRALQLKPHPNEGGFFRETYRSGLSTAIYYLLTPETFSALHRLPGDEIFHFYLGDPVEMLQLHPDGSGTRHLVGAGIEKNMSPQILVPGNVWQGSRLVPGGSFALMGTTMAPAFRFEDYTTGDRDELMRLYPEFGHEITQLTMSP